MKKDKGKKKKVRGRWISSSSILPGLEVVSFESKTESTSSDSHFDQFKSLASKIVAVTKEEIKHFCPDCGKASELGQACKDCRDKRLAAINEKRSAFIIGVPNGDDFSNTYRFTCSFCNKEFVDSVKEMTPPAICPECLDARPFAIPGRPNSSGRRVIKKSDGLS